MITNKLLILSLAVIATNVYAVESTETVNNDNVSVGLRQQVNDLDMRVSDNAVNVDINASNIQANTEAVSGVTKTYYVVDGANQKIGRLINTNLGYYTIINAKGFTVLVTPSGEPLMSGTILLYELSDCTGQAYTRSNKINGTMLIGTENAVMYIPLDAQEVTIPLKYYLQIIGDESNCVIEQTINGKVVPIYPNDPAVTGVPNEDYQGRLTVQLL